MKLTGGGGEQYFEPENDVPYHICSVSIARSLIFLHASVQACVNPCKFVRICASFGEFASICAHLHEFERIFTNLCKSAQLFVIYAPQYEFVQKYFIQSNFMLRIVAKNKIVDLVLISDWNSS